jgi:hypothetical protein
MKSTANRKRVPRQHTLTPSRWGANPAEAISREDKQKLFKRYGITVTPHCVQFPASCSVNMRKIDFQKDMVSAMEVVKYYDGEYAKQWKKLKRLERTRNIQLLPPARPTAYAGPENREHLVRQQDKALGRAVILAAALSDPKYGADSREVRSSLAYLVDDLKALGLLTPYQTGRGGLRLAV